MSRFALVIALLATLVLSSVAQYEEGLPAEIVAVTTNVRANLSADQIDFEASATLQLQIEENRLSVNASLLAELKTLATAEVQAFFDELASKNLITLPVYLGVVNLQVGTAATALAARKLSLVNSLLDEAANWTRTIQDITNLRTNVTSAVMPIVERVRNAYDAWVAHIRRHILDAKVYLTRVRAEHAELTLRYLQAKQAVATRLNELIIAHSDYVFTTNTTILKQQLAELLVEIKLRDHLDHVADEIVKEANARLTAAVIEKLAKLADFINGVHRTAVAIRNDWRSRREAIRDQIRRRVIAFFANIASVDVTVTINEDDVSVSITIVRDDAATEVVVEAKRRLEIVVRTILVALAEVSESDVTVSVRTDSKKRLGGEVFDVSATVGGAESSASVLSPALAAGSLALLAFTQRL